MGDSSVLSAAEKLSERVGHDAYAGGFTIDKNGFNLPGDSKNNPVVQPKNPSKEVPNGNVAQLADNSNNNAGIGRSLAGSTSKILSREELDSLNTYVGSLQEYVDQSINDLNVVINSFNNEAIVNSFYASGNYGSDIKQKLENILGALQKYNTVISSGNDNLIDQTKKYVQRQIDLNETGQ